MDVVQIVDGLIRKTLNHFSPAVTDTAAPSIPSV